jgi:hypothetical protein
MPCPVPQCKKQGMVETDFDFTAFHCACHCRPFFEFKIKVLFIPYSYQYEYTSLHNHSSRWRRPSRTTTAAAAAAVDEAVDLLCGKGKGQSGQCRSVIVSSLSVKLSFKLPHKSRVVSAFYNFVLSYQYLASSSITRRKRLTCTPTIQREIRVKLE